MAYAGTFVVAGQVQGIVVATGLDTEIGRRSSMLRAVETLTTPLIRQIDHFARYLTLAILCVSSAVFILAVWLRSYPWADAFMIVVGLAVAAIPEGLPAVLTITLAISVQRMAARHAIVRRMPAVETLGSVSVICSDKTSLGSDILNLAYGGMQCSPALVTMASPNPPHDCMTVTQIGSCRRYA